MVYLVRLADRALADLEHIYDAIEAESSEAAWRWFNGLVRTIYSLAENSLRGHVTRETKSHRQLIYGKGRNLYRVIYQVDVKNGAVSVVHIRHGARQDFDSD